MTPEDRWDTKVVCGLDGCRSLRTLDNLYKHLTENPDHLLDRERAFRRVEAVLKRVELQHLRSRAPARAKDWTLDTFPAHDVAGRRALKAARHWIEEAGTGMLDHPRMFIHGPPGTGKTGLAYSIAGTWVNYGGHRGVELENVRALLEAQKARFARREGKALDHLLDASYDTLVVLDDLGAGRQTEWTVDTASQIIESLHAQDVPLIVTTNYAPSELAKRLGHPDLNDGARVVSRLREDALVIPLNRSDLRLRKAA